MLRLIVPTTRLHTSWLDARAEFAGAHQDGAGLTPEDEVDTPEGFATWVDRLLRRGDTTLPPEEGRVHATHRWIVEGETYLGAIDLRHTLNDFLLEAGGHIGYSIRPTARRRGLATWALAQALPLARELGIDRVLLTCDPDNAPSARTIRANGGVLEDVRETSIGTKSRYWITL
ncbi:GCN5 family acetyltransferase [Kitasatospora sp. MMS16-BH015]|uniref:GNAT family N-acetyltransferase n=1 Tax=Kitasatospora sp. MMS16-BH015 TaxID=2018025 RepID=UPI000CA37E81|nr:GNAT family N-acetyltransferase [Kitasatospora sp. MMS16-BH015]AUG78432.1 GCN5 family acetyltransferase [Kitasatospora sp. MMS16-BH015]